MTSSSLAIIEMPPVSQRKAAASRENGKLGGVRTAAGKEVSRLNARKHGILGDLKTKYEGNAFEGYRKELFEELQPIGFMEALLVERIALCCLLLYRAGKAEREFMLSRLSPPISDRLSDFDYDESSYRPLVKPEDVERLTNTYLRYQTTIENRLYKAMHELERLQRMRRGESIPSPLTVEGNGFVSQN
ncbi:MAG: hypothetical protein PHE68_02540 [Candidatus Peribacteraceae bacterium]|nr:hypothetical protein [Candidatus Peribacteraceae bacterium]